MKRLRDRMSALLVPSGDGALVAAAPPVPVREILRRFWPDARPYRRWIPLGLVLIAIGGVIETAEIWMFKLVVDEVLVPGELQPLVWIVAAYIGLTIFNGLVTFGDDYLATWLAERFLQRMRRRVFSHVQTLSVDVLDRRRLGDLIARLTSDVQAIESFVLSGVADGLSALLRILFFSAALFYLQWQLALVALVVTPIFLLVAKRFSGLIKHASREKRRRSGSLSAVAEESLANQMLVQASNRQDAELRRFERENERMIELLDEKPRIVDRPNPVVIARARGVVELEDVAFGYPGAAEPALRDVALRAEPGQKVALVGPSGSGKTTLAKLLLRFYDPEAGTVRLDGRDLRDLELASLRRNVSILLQETPVLHGSLRDNISFARPDASDEEIRRAAEAAGVAGFAKALPDGYDTDLGERGRRLSGGQRQRVAIARALLADAPVLVLDEPSTGLDAEARSALDEPLRRLMSDRTTIVISHDLLTVRDADQILVLEGGRVAERGSHAELVAAGGRYASMWALHDAADPVGAAA